MKCQQECQECGKFCKNMEDESEEDQFDGLVALFDGWDAVSRVPF